MRRALVVLLLLVLPACKQAVGREVVSGVVSGRVVAVHDGDSITIVDRRNVRHRVRLAGVDAPERHQAFSEVSKRHLSELAFQKDVTVQVTKTDQYERLVGKVMRGDRDLSLAQIDAGLGWFYAFYQDELASADRVAYLAAERAARAEQRGLWRDRSPVAPWRFRREARSSGP